MYLFNDYSSSYEELLTRSNLKNLEIQRQKALLCEIYKSINDIGPTYMRDIFMIRREHSRKGLLLEEFRTRTSAFGTHSVRSLGPKLWNGLALHIKQSKSLSELKTNLKDYAGTVCKCAQCK